MNNNQRRRLLEISGQLGDFREELDTMSIDEREKYDNLPESLQLSDAGERIEQAAELLEEAVIDLESAVDSIEEAVNL